MTSKVLLYDALCTFNSEIELRPKKYNCILIILPTHKVFEDK